MFIGRALPLLVVVLDESGSMGSCDEKAQGIVNKALEKSRSVEGMATYAGYGHDLGIDAKVYRYHFRTVPSKKADISLNTHRGTSCEDPGTAIVGLISDIGLDCAKFPVSDVKFITVSDGQDDTKGTRQEIVAQSVKTCRENGWIFQNIILASDTSNFRCFGFESEEITCF